MNNVKVITDEYVNIQGINVKKIKLAAHNLEILKRTKPDVERPIIEEKKPISEIKPITAQNNVREEKVPSYLNNYENKVNEREIKTRLEEKYGNHVKAERKEEKRETSVVVEKPKITETDFEKLLSSNVVIMEDKMEKFREVFKEKQTKLKEARLEQTKLADSFQRTSSDEQLAKTDNEFKKKRTAEMKKAEHFTYLEIGKDEDDRMIEAVRIADEALKNLYNVNQIIYKETSARIEQYENDKQIINQESEKVRGQIHSLSEELNKFMENNVSLINEIIKINEKYKNAEAESERAIGDEYDALTRDKETKVGVDSEVINNENVSYAPNIFDNYRQQGSNNQVNNDAFSMNNSYFEGQDFQNLSVGRTA